METCVPPEYPSTDNILYLIADDDSMILGLFEECIRRDKAKYQCLKTLQEKGLLRADAK